LQLAWKKDNAIDRNTDIKMPDMILESVEPKMDTIAYATGE
jgi:hypothetical protein